MEGKGGTLGGAGVPRLAEIGVKQQQRSFPLHPGAGWGRTSREASLREEDKESHHQPE